VPEGQYTRINEGVPKSGSETEGEALIGTTKAPVV